MSQADLNYRNIIKFLLLIKPYWRNISALVISGLILTILSLPYPWIAKLLIDEVMLRQDRSFLYAILLITFVITLIRAILTALRGYYFLYIQHAMAYQIQFDFYKHIQRLSFSFYDRKEVAEVLSRMRDASQSRRILIDVINTIVTNMLYLSIVPLVVFLMNWRLALIACITLPGLFISLAILSRIVRKYARITAEMRAEINARNYESLSGIREIQALGAENRILIKMKHLYLVYRKIDMKMRALSTLREFIGTITTAIGTLLYGWYGASLTIKGDMTVGDLVAFTAFIAYLYNPISSIMNLMVPIQEVLIYTKRFYDVFDTQPEIKDPHKPRKIEKLKGKIAFSNVSFAYEDGLSVLTDIDLSILPGTKVAIVGKTGSGKSTLASLIPRFYDSQQGEVTIDNVNVKELSLKFLRSQIGVLMQHPFIFNGSILDNITLGNPGFTKQQVIQAAINAKAHDFIENSTDGYDTLIGERGVRLSGGEQQRIAISRVFLLNRPILILDEATTGIDHNTESQIREALNLLCEERTTIIIDHKLANVRNADCIIVLDNGKVVEQGKHQKLLENKKLYYQLYQKARNPNIPFEAD